MNEPKITELRKYLAGINKLKKKYVTSEALSKVVGIYPEVINETLSYFEPMLMMDPEFNLLELVQDIKNYIYTKEEEKIAAEEANPIPKVKLAHYTSIIDFVYKKLSAGGGMINRNAVLTEEDLLALKKVVSKELRKVKK